MSRIPTVLSFLSYDWDRELAGGSPLMLDSTS